MSTVRLPTRQRRWPAYVIGAVVLIALLFTFMSQFYVDLLWFREVGFPSVFWAELRTKVLLGVVFGIAFFALLYVNLLIVRRLAPTTRFLTPDQEAIERVRQSFEPYLRWVLPIGCAVLALLVAIGVTREWQTFLLWRNSGGVEFGNPEPLFDRDPAFYIFSLPWLKFLQGWLFSSLVGVTLLTAVAHFLWGGIRPQAPAWADRVTPAARAHLSVLLGLIMLVKAWGYYLGRFDLLGSTRGVVQGASYTDVNAQLPALNFLMIAALICAVLFLVNIRVRLWSLPVIALALLAVVSVLLGTAYPAFVQRFRVTPQEFQREEEYIADNIVGTRTAFAIGDEVEIVPEQSYTPVVTAKDIEENVPTIDNIRVWRPAIIGENFLQLQRIRSYYEFRDVDVDRYTLEDKRTVLMVSGREVSQAGIQADARTWQNEHLVYTHGYGAVSAFVNQATSEGAPALTLSDIPLRFSPGPELTRPELYFGEGDPGDARFVVVGTKTPELNFEGSTTPYAYDGTGGIEMGNVLQRALFAWRFRDVNLLISGQIESTSRIMIYRDLASRVPKPVPFLSFDNDPYLALSGGRMVWIWDAYTSTDQYPYSQAINLAEATDDQLPPAEINYMRNSVKVVVDAYEGTMDYYADMSDPFIQVWSRAFPDLFTPIESADADLQSHFRYPENLFQVQATQFANYHVTDPQVFYQKQDRWEIPADPTLAQPLVDGETAAPPVLPQDARRLRPYYLLMKAPGESEERFQLVLPFVPEGRLNMVAWLTANSDPGPDYGRLLALELPDGANVDGPAVVFSRMNQNPQFSTERTLLGQGGSKILFGDFLVIPINDSFLYVQPVYVRANQATAVPELKRVIVANGDSVGLGDTIGEALDNSIQGEVDGGGGEPPPPDGGGVDQSVTELLDEALSHFEAAQEALTQGDLATYQAELEEAQALIEEANDLANQGATQASPTASPTPEA